MMIQCHSLSNLLMRSYKMAKRTRMQRQKIWKKFCDLPRIDQYELVMDADSVFDDFKDKLDNHTDYDVTLDELEKDIDERVEANKKKWDMTFINIRCGTIVVIRLKLFSHTVVLSHYTPSYETLVMCEARGDSLPTLSHTSLRIEQYDWCKKWFC